MGCGSSKSPQVMPTIPESSPSKAAWISEDQDSCCVSNEAASARQHIQRCESATTLEECEAPVKGTSPEHTQTLSGNESTQCESCLRTTEVPTHFHPDTDCSTNSGSQTEMECAQTSSTTCLAAAETMSSDNSCLQTPLDLQACLNQRHGYSLSHSPRIQQLQLQLGFISTVASTTGQL